MSPELLKQIEARDLSDSETLPALEAMFVLVPDKELGEAINMVKDRRTLLDYCRELEAERDRIQKSHDYWDQKHELLEEALDWMMMQETGWYHKDPPHLAPILEASRKRNMGEQS